MALHRAPRVIGTSGNKEVEKEKKQAVCSTFSLVYLSLWKTRKANKKEGEWDIVGKLSDFVCVRHGTVMKSV